MKKLNWGILSTASIATKHIIPAINNVKNNNIKAVASRSIDKAKKCAEDFNIDRYYDNYDNLINDPDLNIIYIPLPNSLHKEWVIKTAKKKKHILCEKPIAINSTEIKAMIETTEKNNIKLIEGFMYRYQPFILKLKELIKSEIGKLRFLDVNLCYTSTRPDNDIRFNYKMGGGALFDVGCYTVDLARFLIGEMPRELYNIFYRDENNRIDHTGKAILKFENNITANLLYSFKSFPYKDFTAIGTKGKIYVKNLFEWFPENRTIKIIKEDNYEEISFKPQNPYILEIENIYQHIVNNKKLPDDLTGSLNNMIIIDNLFESVEKNSIIKI